MSVSSAKKVETAETTEPSMMPMIGTMSEERRVTRRRKRKKTMVPIKAKATEPTMRTRMVEPGKRTIVKSRPRPAHSVVPVVDGSVKRFCVSSCITRPLMAMAAPASTSAMVRGTRVVINMSKPSPCENRSYSPVASEASRSASTPMPPSTSFQSHRRRRVRGASSVSVMKILKTGGATRPLR